MVKVRLARHLIRFFPHLDGKSIEVQADDTAQVVAELDRIAPGIAFYICDEAGQPAPARQYQMQSDRADKHRTRRPDVRVNRA